MFGTIRSFAITLILVSAMLACESKPAQQAAPQPDGGAAIADIGQGDAVQGDATDTTASWDIPKPPAACEPDNPKPWEEWVIANHLSLAAPSGPEPSLDAQCTPQYDTACASVCDCKFIQLGCSIGAAQLNVPWSWIAKSGPEPGGGCWRNPKCDGGTVPQVGVHHLACVAGHCQASGPGSVSSWPPPW